MAAVDWATGLQQGLPQEQAVSSALVVKENDLNNQTVSQALQSLRLVLAFRLEEARLLELPWSLQAALWPLASVTAPSLKPDDFTDCRSSLKHHGT